MITCHVVGLPPVPVVTLTVPAVVALSVKTKVIQPISAALPPNWISVVAAGLIVVVQTNPTVLPHPLTTIYLVLVSVLLTLAIVLEAVVTVALRLIAVLLH